MSQTGRAQVSVEEKKAGKTVAETLAETELPLGGSDLGTVSVSLKRTVNLGNYESLAIGVTVTLPIDKELRVQAEAQADEALKRAYLKAGKTLAEIKEKKAPGGK